MKAYFYWLLTLVFIFSSLKAFTQIDDSGYLLVSGEIVNAANTPIEGAHILNTSTNELAISDASGFFSINMHTSHVLRISSVGFKTYYFNLRKAQIPNSSFLKITMQTVSVGLKNVDVVAEKELRATNLFRPKPTPLPFNFGYQGQQKAIKPTVLNPVSLLYNWLSKEGKQNRKLEELLKQEEIRKWIAQRYESDIVWELTGYTGKELEAFKIYCGLTDTFVKNASDYDFLVKIRACYNAYTPQTD